MRINLGDMYAKGEGVPKDDKETVKWYRKAAEQGYARAQVNLGLQYIQGEGVPEDDVTAYVWLTIADANGHEIAKEMQSILAETMTPDQIAKAEALVKEMTTKNPKLLNK